MNLGSSECTEPSLVWNQSPSQAVLKNVVSRDFLLKNSVCRTSSVSWRNLRHCFISFWFFSMSFYITFKKKTLACGWQEGHIQIALWVSGSASVTHFLPCPVYYGNQLLLPEQLTLTNEALQVDHRMKLFGFSVSIKTATAHIWGITFWTGDSSWLYTYPSKLLFRVIYSYVATMIIGCYVSKIMTVQKTYIHMYMQLHDN